MDEEQNKMWDRLKHTPSQFEQLQEIPQFFFDQKNRVLEMNANETEFIFQIGVEPAHNK